MRRIAAQYLFTGKAMIPRGVVTLDDTGKVLAVEQLAETETCSTEFYNGILSPGFVNAHCHLELSHFRGATLPQQGLTHFVNALKDWHKHTMSNGQSMRAAMKQADEDMLSEGIVAVGDICNTNHSFSLKTKSKIFYHSFVEAVGLDEELAQEKIAETEEVWKDALRMGLPASITPHALYSMSPSLLDYAFDAANNSGILSIHYKEGRNESHEGSWHFCERLNRNTRLLLIHNTFISPADVETVNYATGKAVWVLCPRSNQYVNGSLPPVDLLYYKGQRIAIGTDSLASNYWLSILDELKVLSYYFAQIPLEVLLKWATIGGATALNKTDEFGLIIPGRRPGLILIEGVDFFNMKLLSSAEVKRIV